MYVTRRLSMYKKDPSALSLPPPDGPNTGILVIQDVQNTFLHTLRTFYSYDITTGLPYPQNTCLYGVEHPGDTHGFMAIPVIDKPLCTGLYYLIAVGNSPYAGDAYWSKKGKELTWLAFFCTCDDPSTPQAVSKPLEVSDIYQQFYLRKPGCLFRAVSPAPDGLVPTCLTELKSVYSNFDGSVYSIDDDAFGLDHSLRKRLPKFDFLLSCERSDAVPVGKWYCPFMFVKEQHLSCKDQTRVSMYYEMSLVQQWIRVFFCNREDHDVTSGCSVPVDLNVKTQVISVAGMANDHCGNVRVADGITWFEGVDKEGQDVFMGLNTIITDKIDKDQESFGWVRESDKVKIVENFEGNGEWKRFGCYLLAEKYVLKSLTKRLVLTIEFWHTHKLRCKWEYE